MIERLLRVEAPSFVAGAVLARYLDSETGEYGWICVRCAPILRRHMLGKDAAEIRRVIQRMGWSYCWP